MRSSCSMVHERMIQKKSNGKWGQANYFAVNASYSHAFSHKNDSGLREMFLVKVITGDSCTCLLNSSLQMPPLNKNTGQL